MSSLLNPPISTALANKAMKCTCKIKIQNKDNYVLATGFFLKVSDKLKCLVTNHHVINDSTINSDISLEIWNKTKTKLIPSGRFIKYFKMEDVTIIEIKETDEIYKNVEFFNYDNNGIAKGYSIYKNESIFSIQYPYEGEAFCSSGKIIEIDEFEFGHNMPTTSGSGGCPIILLNNNINLILLIGIHKSRDREKDLGYATFIGEIIKKLRIVISNNTPNHDKKNDNFNRNSTINKNVNRGSNNNNLFNSCNINYNLNNDINKYLNNHNFDKGKIEKFLDLTNGETITLHFKSGDHSLNYAVHCRNNDKFNFVVSKILENEPLYIERKFSFVSNGMRINEYKSLKDNQLKNGDIVIMIIEE